MRYLISGMPRCRTAWLAAVLRAHGSKAYHDIYARGLTLNGPYGVVDPAIALVTPQDGLDQYVGDPSFCIHADSLTERLTALEKSAGVVFTDSARDVFADNYRIYSHNTPRIHVQDLDDNDIVGEIVRACTRQAPSLDIISTFQLFKIEEHMPKARLLRLPDKQWRSEEYQRSLRRMKPGTSTTLDESLTEPRTPPLMISG